MQEEHIITNFSELATTPARANLLRVVESGLAAVDAKTVIASSVSYDSNTTELAVGGHKFVLRDYHQVFLLGIGKVALGAAQQLVAQLGDALHGGYVISNKIGATTHPNVVCRQADHPLPSSRNVAHTAELLQYFSTVSSRDLVLCLVGGGGSSLFCRPKSVSCDLQNSMVSHLMKAGASIVELNTVRKHLSSVKGGQLAKYLYPASVVSLIFSDVPGDDLSMVASGPTVLDTTTMQDAGEIMQRYGVLPACGLESCELVETPKEPMYFSRLTNILLCSSQTALLAMQAKARDLGLKPKIMSASMTGRAAKLYPELLGDLASGECVLAGGELEVEVLGGGRGGRNTHTALGALEFLPQGAVFASVASDGVDNGDYAGALVDEGVKQQARSKGLDAGKFLAESNSAEFFEQAGGLLKTGVLDSNVSDLFCAVK